MIVDAQQGKVIKLGRLGENEARTVRFLIRDVLHEHPDAEFTLLNKRPGDQAAYPVPVANVRVDGFYLFWTVTSGDLTKKGEGVCELVATDDGAICKSVFYGTEVLDALDGSGTVPEPWTGWVTQVTDAADRAEAAATLLESPGAEAVKLAPGSNPTAVYAEGVFTFGLVTGDKGDAGSPGEPGQPGKDGKDGADGHSPVITTSKSGKTTTILSDGSSIGTVLDGNDGQNGQDGQDGADGYSPTATVTKSGKVATITITDKNGTTQETVSDGADADPTTIIDDTSTAQNKVWSANKSNDLLSAINVLEPTASAGDVGKVLKAKTVADGKVSEYEFGSLPSVPVTDVQVNGTSVLSQGVANVPVASDNVFGVMKIMASNGIALDTNKRAYIFNATSQIIKTGTNEVRPITPNRQQESVFYGLAKAAGDTSQSSSANAVGTYTEDAKSKISDMLNAPVSVSGTTPSITAKAGVRYVCGECSTLTIVAPASGCIDVVFASGSTATVLTVSSAKTGVSAIKWANGFDPTSLDTNTTYEVNILDGEFGVVGKWT